MKKIIYTLSTVILTVLLFANCSGSDVYQGEWKAMDTAGNKYEIIFDANSFIVKTANGETSTHSYSQNSFKNSNSIKTYGIKLGDGRSYSIHFPIPKDNSKAIILSKDKVLYTMCRTEYISSEDIYKLN